MYSFDDCRGSTRSRSFLEETKYARLCEGTVDGDDDAVEAVFANDCAEAVWLFFWQWRR